MSVLLINPFTREVAAELISDEKITIRDQQMKERVEKAGIALYPNFKDTHKERIEAAGIALKQSRIYPSDDESLFALAFKECYFVHGLQQQGFFWRDKSKHFE